MKNRLKNRIGIIQYTIRYNFLNKTASGIISNLSRKIINCLKGSETTRALLVLFFILVILFLPAIFSGKIYSASDILQNYETFNTGLVTTIQNGLFADPLSQFEPWFRFNIDSLKSGVIPLWNPYQGNGTPHIANMQSAFFYPLSWFVFLFGIKQGLAILYFSKLFFIGIFTYLFLKEIGANYKASTIGSIAFMFSGYITNWLFWPHTNVVFFLPLSLFLIEKMFKTNHTKYYLLFSVGLAAAIFGGHPETFAHITLAATLYFFFKLFSPPTNRKIKLFIILKFGTFSMFGFLLAAIQLIPFFEYLLNSQVYISRTGANTNFLPPQLFSLNLIPDLFGNQTIDHFYLNLSNYNEITNGYAGLTILFFALLSLIYLYKDKVTIFFSALALLSLTITYKAPLIFSLFTSLPVFDKSANHRILFVFAFSISVLGTLFLSKIFESKIVMKKKFLAIFWMIYAGSVSGMAILSVNIFSQFIDNQEKYGFYLQKISLIYILDIVLLLIVLMFAKKLKIFPLLIGSLILLEVGLHIFIYEPTINKNLFFPKTTLTEFLKENIGNHRFVSVSESAYLGPNMGSYYQISDVRNYDAMLVKDYSDNFNMYSNNELNWQNIKSINPEYLNMTGVKYIVARNTNEFLQSLSLAENDLNQYPRALEEKKFVVFENKNVLPRAFFVQPDIIEKKAPWTKSDIEENISVDIKEYGSKKITIFVNNPKVGFVVLTDTFFPGWNVYVNGIKKEIKKTALATRAVLLDPGEHEIIFRYEPISFRLGLLISFVTMIGIIYGFLLTIKKQLK
ncbi:MAG: YfhO family protein [Patescibacteria group bacterium]|jgi:uncharacterized membrane protein YfhO|nr:YfhO family protein [Patescibacteria group bacterium]